MNPHARYLDVGDRQLFTCLHGAGSQEGGLGAVLCPSEGQESIRSHAALRGLADLLAGAGFPSLRLDYSGTGDSSGEPPADAAERWPVEIAAAAAHLAREAGVARVALVGLRLGALLALRAARRVDGLDSVVLWHPPADGAAWVDELRARHDAWSHGSFAEVRTAPHEQLLGFEYSPDYTASLCALEPAISGSPAARAALLLVAEGAQAPPGLLAASAAIADGVDVLDLPTTAFWVQKDEELLTSVGPRRELRVIREWITSRGSGA